MHCKGIPEAYTLGKDPGPSSVYISMRFHKVLSGIFSCSKDKRTRHSILWTFVVLFLLFFIYGVLSDIVGSFEVLLLIYLKYVKCHVIYKLNTRYMTSSRAGSHLTPTYDKYSINNTHYVLPNISKSGVSIRTISIICYSFKN